MEVFWYNRGRKRGNMNPLRDCILVEVDKVEEQTKSGLYVKENWAKLPPHGVVKAIGPDVKEVKVGDRILFNRYAALQLEGNERLITEKDVQAIIKPEKKHKTAPVRLRNAKSKTI